MPYPHNEAKGVRIGGGVQVGTWRHRAVLAARLAFDRRPTGPRLRGDARATLTSFLALDGAPGVTPGPFREVLLASWVAVAVVALVNCVFDVGSDDAFLARVMRLRAPAPSAETAPIGSS